MLTSIRAHPELARLDSWNVTADEFRERATTLLRKFFEEDFGLGSMEENQMFQLLNEALGFGALDRLLADSTVDEIMVNGYDTIYTERYMSTPQKNPEGYKTTSVQGAAANLHGKLMIIHGSMDDNVHLQNTIQLVYKLQQAGKQFELMIYPKSRHGVKDTEQVYHMRRMMTDFILENL